MINAIISQLDPKIKCTSSIVHDKQIIFKLSSIQHSVKCPYCDKESDKVHSVYEREIQDISLQEKQVILLLHTRKLFCANQKCNYKTFSERFDFVPVNG